MSVPASSKDYSHSKTHVDGVRVMRASSSAIAMILYGLACGKGLTDG